MQSIYWQLMGIGLFEYGRTAMTRLWHDPYRGFEAEVRLGQAFQLVCDTLEEIATTSLSTSPLSSVTIFSPVQHLWQHPASEDVESQRTAGIKEALLNMAELVRNPSWANRFLVHLPQDLANSQYARPLTAAACIECKRCKILPHSAYSLFMEHTVGIEKYQKYTKMLKVAAHVHAGMPSWDQMDQQQQDRLYLLWNRTNRSMSQLQIRIHNLTRGVNDFMPLHLEFGAASLQWWNMSGSQRKVWEDMHQYRLTLYSDLLNDVMKAPSTDRFKFEHRVWNSPRNARLEFATIPRTCHHCETHDLEWPFDCLLTFRGQYRDTVLKYCYKHLNRSPLLERSYKLRHKPKQTG